MTPETRAELLIDLVSHLIDIMEKENVILDHPKSVDLGPIVAEKQVLFQSYETQLQELARDPSFTIHLDDGHKAALRTLCERFEEVQKVNERKLRVAVTSSNMIVDRIREAATQATGTSLNSYGKSGTQQAYEKKAAPVAINETL